MARPVETFGGDDAFVFGGSLISFYSGSGYSWVQNFRNLLFNQKGMVPVTSVHASHELISVTRLFVCRSVAFQPLWQRHRVCLGLVEASGVGCVPSQDDRNTFRVSWEVGLQRRSVLNANAVFPPLSYLGNTCVPLPPPWAPPPRSLK